MMSEQNEKLCEMCKVRPVAVRITEVAHGKTRELHLCSECAQKMGVDEETAEADFSVSKLAAGIGETAQNTSEEPSAEAVCSFCGMRYEEFKESGKLGCPQCYDSFESELTALIRRLHGNLRHTGRGPGEKRAEHAVQMELATLRKQLADAIAKEAYEEAARLRDRIAGLKGDRLTSKKGDE
jgi:protein arginine kinase activator